MPASGLLLPAPRSPLPALFLLLMSPAAPGQVPPAGEMTADSTPSKTQKVADLTGRYRFSERYTLAEKEVGPGVIGAYRVAVRDMVRDSVESAKGAPKPTDSTRQAIYTERPAELLSGTASVTSTYRTIEKFQVRPLDASKMMGSRPLEGASVFLKPRTGELATILGLTSGRTLTEYEYDTLARQIFVPSLPSLLPTQVVRLGDTWRISRRGAQALVGDVSPQGDSLVGKLAEIRKEVDGPRMVASITITGKVAGAAGDTIVNAEALFTFQAVTLPKDPEKRISTSAKIPDDVTEGRGAITELRLASVASGPLPGPGRLRFQSNRELTLHRQLGVVAGGVAPPSPEKPPEPNEANAWIAHVDPSGRYSFRHPQEMLPPDRNQPASDPKTTLLVRTRREGTDMLQVEFIAKTLAPEDLKKELAEKYRLFKAEILKGEEAWLPESEWPGMRVHRIDAAVKLGDPKAIGVAGSTRVHFDGYLIQFARSASILAIATTSRESVGPVRQEVEQILKSIQLDPARPIAN
jgi:hypothetical protein